MAKRKARAETPEVEKSVALSSSAPSSKRNAPPARSPSLMELTASTMDAFPRLGTLCQAKSTGFLEVKARYLDVTSAFNHSVDLGASYSIRTKDCIKDSRARVQTELGPDVSTQRMADLIAKASPKWTMQARWKKGEHDECVPGPGAYPLNERSRQKRGWHMGTEERKTFADSNRESPAPDAYSVTGGRWGTWTVRTVTVKSRTGSHPPERQASGLWSAGHTSTEFVLPRKLGDTREMDRRGPHFSPKFTFNPRPESTLIPRGEPTPGPGANKVKHGQNSKIRSSPSFGFGTSKRPEPGGTRHGKLEMRPY